jgi:hypothetical protein
MFFEVKTKKKDFNKKKLERGEREAIESSFKGGGGILKAFSSYFYFSVLQSRFLSVLQGGERVGMGMGLHLSGIKSNPPYRSQFFETKWSNKFSHDPLD